jgi:predicted regulator of Ras-like GTPase activity (Roadblock/LC7/MglB family)
MDAQQALADLTEISSQIKAAVVLDGKGAVVGSTLPDGAALAQAATELLAAADELSPGASPLAQLEVATAEGSVFVVRQPGATIAATTAAGPTVGLVFYDLKSALRSVEPDEPKAKPKPKPAGRTQTSAPAARKSGTARKAAAKKASSKKASAKKSPPKDEPDAS